MTKETPDQFFSSRERIRDFGEVFTGSREVEEMLDLVQDQSERIDSRFLEPACGTGNFLVAVLQRKLDTVSRLYRRSEKDYERYAMVAITSLYGIDLILQNVEMCRKRLLDCIVRNYLQEFDIEPSNPFKHCLRFLLLRNIVHGDALTMKQVTDEQAPIVFSQWSLIGSNKVSRRDYEFRELFANEAGLEPDTILLDPEYIRSDSGDTVFIPNPIGAYPPVHYLKLKRAEN